MARFFSKEKDSFYYEVACRLDEIILAETVGEMPSQQELKEMYFFSPEFEQKMEKLINGIEERRIIPSAVKRIIIVAAIIAALVFGALSASAIYNVVYNLYINCLGNHSMATFNQSNETDLSVDTDIVTFYEPSFIPHGYEKIRHTNCGIENRICYSDGSDELVFTQSNIGAFKQIDTEKNVALYFSIGDWNAHYVENGDYITLVWEEYGYCFVLEGVVSFDTAVYIAQNIEKVE